MDPNPESLPFQEEKTQREALEAERSEMLQNSEVALADVRAQLEADLEAEVAAHAASQEQVHPSPDHAVTARERRVLRWFCQDCNSFTVIQVGYFQG